MTEGKAKNRKPDILRVSLRILLIAVFCVGALFIYIKCGKNGLSTLHLAGIGALLLGAAVILIQLIVWGLKWTKQERVSELGLHIMRYWVILASIALCVFVLLSYDYSGLYTTTTENELRQQALAGRIYVQSALGDELGESEEYYAALAQRLNGMLVDGDEKDGHYACLYLRTDKAPENSSVNAYDGGYVCCSASEKSECSADVSVLDEVMLKSEVMLDESRKSGAYSVMAAYSPVFTASGEPVGVLEVYKLTDGGLSIFHFATLELCFKLLALIVFFSFAFYGSMQLIDISLRPKNFDKSRRVLSCGRESARPVLFFVAFSAALPLMMLMFADNLRSLMDVYELPLNLGVYVPLVVYILGIFIGQLFGSIDRPTLSEIPADAGLVFSFLCNLGLCIFMDWKKFSGLGLSGNVILMLVLIFVSGLGYGIAYRVTSKFQAQSDALFGYDKYAYLCSCLGAMSGIALGGLLIENYSNVFLRAVSCILTAFTAVISIILLEDLKATVDTDESSGNDIRSFAGLVFGVLPVGLACCFNWVYLAGYMFENGISVAAVAFCVVAPVIAFCFGNRLRLKKRGAKRTAMIISAVLAAASFVPMMLSPSFNMAALSCGIICIAVIFAASAVYSMTRHAELKRFTSRLIPLMFVGIIAAAALFGVDDERIALGSAAAASLLFMLIFLLSGFPRDRVPQIKFRPGITDGTMPAAQPAAAKPSREEIKNRKAEEKARLKAEKEAEKEKLKADKEAEKAAKEAEKEAEKAAKESEKENKKKERGEKKGKDKDKEEAAPVIIPEKREEERREEKREEPEPFEPLFTAPIIDDEPDISDLPDEPDFSEDEMERRREEAARLARERWQKREEESAD